MKKTVLCVLLGATLACGLRLAGRRPQALSAAQFVSGLSRLTPGLRLEVARLDLIKSAAGESRKVVWGLDWGTTKAVVSVPARARYTVDLSGERPVAFFEKGDSLEAVFPDPEVSSVELFLEDKRALVAPGWGRLAARSGAALQDSLERGLRASTQSDAARPEQINRVKEAARPLLEKLVADYAAARGVKRRVEIRFSSRGPAGA